MSDMLRLLTAEVTKASGTVPAENINKMWSTVVTGLVVVFIILILLVIILWVLGKVMNIKIKPKESEKAAAAPAPAAVPVPAPANAPEEEYEEDDGEIIAVIAAAVAAYGEAEGKQYKIASVRRKEKAVRSSWGAAGVAENTRPF